MSPQVRENRIIGSRAPVLLQIIEPDPDRDRHAFAADHAFAIAQRRDGFEKAARAFGHSASNIGLIAIIVEAHGDDGAALRHHARSEEHTSELQSLMRISYAVFCLTKKITINHTSSNI